MKDLDKKVILSAFIGMFIIALGFVFIFSKPEYNPTVTFYTPSGQIRQPTRVWDGIITPTTGSGQTIDISSAGFSVINSVTVTAANNTATVASMPIVMIKSYTTSQVTINILTSNSTLVSILGANVAGLTTASSVSGMTVHVRVDGW